MRNHFCLIHLFHDALIYIAAFWLKILDCAPDRTKLLDLVSNSSSKQYKPNWYRSQCAMRTSQNCEEIAKSSTLLWRSTNWTQIRDIRENQDYDANVLTGPQEHVSPYYASLQYRYYYQHIILIIVYLVLPSLNFPPRTENLLPQQSRANSEYECNFQNSSEWLGVLLHQAIHQFIIPSYHSTWNFEGGNYGATAVLNYVYLQSVAGIKKAEIRPTPLILRSFLKISRTPPSVS